MSRTVQRASDVAVRPSFQRAKQQIEDLQQDMERLRSQLTDALAAEKQARKAAKEVEGRSDTERDELRCQLTEAVQKADENQAMWTEKLMEMQKVCVSLCVCAWHSISVLRQFLSSIFFECRKLPLLTMRQPLKLKSLQVVAASQLLLHLRR